MLDAILAVLLVGVVTYLYILVVQLQQALEGLIDSTRNALGVLDEELFRLSNKINALEKELSEVYAKVYELEKGSGVKRKRNRSSTKNAGTSDDLGKSSK